MFLMSSYQGLQFPTWGYRIPKHPTWAWILRSKEIPEPSTWWAGLLWSSVRTFRFQDRGDCETVQSRISWCSYCGPPGCYVPRDRGGLSRIMARLNSTFFLLKLNTYPLGNQVFHSLCYTISKLGQVFRRQGFAHFASIFGEVEEGRLLHSMFTQMGQQFSVHHIFHHQQIRLWKLCVNH